MILDAENVNNKNLNFRDQLTNEIIYDLCNFYMIFYDFLNKLTNKTKTKKNYYLIIYFLLLSNSKNQPSVVVCALNPCCCCEKLC